MNIFQPYQPSAWYWIVAGNAQQVYSAPAAAFVPSADPTYQAFLAKGFLPAQIGALQDLYDLLQSNGVALPAGGTSAAPQPLNKLIAAINAKVGIVAVVP